MIVNNPAIRSFDPRALFAAFNTRFLVGLSLAANYALGGLDPFGYHLLNVLVHAAASAAVFFLALWTLRAPSLEGSAEAERGAWVALAAALFFAAHPLQTQAVNYVWQRAASMGAFFYAASLACYARWRLSGARGWALAAFKLGFLGMFAKETTFTLPFAVLLYEFAFFGGRWKKAAPFLALLAVIPLTLTRAGGVTLEIMRPLSATASGFDPTRWVPESAMARKDYLLTQLSVVRTYLRLLVWPSGLNLDWDYPVSRVFDARVLGALGLHAAIWAGAAWLWKKGARWIAFGIFWFYLALSLESAVVQRDVLFEHRMYLPMIAASLVWAGLAARAVKDRVLFLVAALGAPLFLGAVSFQRNQVWKDQRTLWEDVVRKSPSKARPRYNLANIHKKEGELDLAMEGYRKAIEIDPGYVDAYLNLANAHSYRREYGRALPLYERAARISPGYAAIWMNMGNAYYSLGAKDRAIELYRKSIALKPDYAEAHLNLGHAYASLGLMKEAEKEVAEAVRLNPALGPKKPSAA